MQMRRTILCIQYVLGMRHKHEAYMRLMPAILIARYLIRGEFPSNPAIFLIITLLYFILLYSSILFHPSSTHFPHSFYSFSIPSETAVHFVFSTKVRLSLITMLLPPSLAHSLTIVQISGCQTKLPFRIHSAQITSSR